MKLFLGAEKNQFENCDFWSNFERVMQSSNAPCMLINFFQFSRLNKFDIILNHSSCECFVCLENYFDICDFWSNFERVMQSIYACNMINDHKKKF